MVQQINMSQQICRNSQASGAAVSELISNITEGLYPNPGYNYGFIPGYSRILYYNISGGSSQATDSTTCSSWSTDSGHNDYKAWIPTA